MSPYLQKEAFLPGPDLGWEDAEVVGWATAVAERPWKRGGELFILPVRPSHTDPACALEEVEGEVEVEMEVELPQCGHTKAHSELPFIFFG